MAEQLESAVSCSRNGETEHGERDRMIHATVREGGAFVVFLTSTELGSTATSAADSPSVCNDASSA